MAAEAEGRDHVLNSGGGCCDPRGGGERPSWMAAPNMKKVPSGYSGRTQELPLVRLRSSQNPKIIWEKRNVQKSQPFRHFLVSLLKLKKLKRFSPAQRPIFLCVFEQKPVHIAICPVCLQIGIALESAISLLESTSPPNEIHTNPA